MNGDGRGGKRLKTSGGSHTLGGSALFDCNKLAMMQTGNTVALVIPDSITTTSSSSSSSSSSSTNQLLTLTEAEFIALIQNAINFVPSIQVTKKRGKTKYHYPFLTNLFVRNFNLCKKTACERMGGRFSWIDTEAATYMEYEPFMDLCAHAVRTPSNAKRIQGLYPVGPPKGENGYIHYYIVIATASIGSDIMDKFVTWFSSRGALNNYNQDEEFVNLSPKSQSRCS